ncbi:hypothetical protein DICPUDRAFT_82298 [Dictyostelium purpureum]|uniref:Uncharacterized protein n=1 Tax=Dictyostelium purpureum TaxID=5786 RepID=F0ZW45_DICPU|nr:uncharacterized protein DICPUDRAFT_82298 [Dictyostelium purpureum]EGC31834.1 hypothetical protein DICPUDRAFT_82298 [Dictyostelium purpureum]|eukprot:XP_003291635.1 hypothetical protein DICPUDRAFT_82298 [Dictyostelium purpureum]
MLISSKLGVCLGSIEFSCDQNSTTETYYKDNDCNGKTNSVSFNNNVCNKNGEYTTCTSDPKPNIPANSYVMGVYPNTVLKCYDETKIIQYNTIPLNVCSFGIIYTCTSKSLIVKKYSDDKCSNYTSKSEEPLGCVHNNPFYRTIYSFCT